MTNRITIDDRQRTLMEAMWEHLPHRLMLVDAKGRIAVASPALERALGYSLGRLRGSAVADLVRDVAGHDCMSRDNAPPLSAGQLVQLVNSAGQGVLMRVAEVFDLLAQDQSYRTIMVHALSEWSEDALRWPRELEALAAVSFGVCQALDLASILQSALDKVGELLELETGVILLLNEEGNAARVAAHRGARDEELRERDKVEIGRGIVGAAMSTGQPLLISDLADSHIETRARAMGFRAVAIAPIIVRGQALGCIALCSRKRKDFPQGAEDVLRMMGVQVGMAVDNSRLLQHEAARARQLEAAVQELHHRVKNNLETLSAIIELARGRASDSDLVDRLLERIGAMAAVHGLLREGQWGEEADAAELVSQVVSLIGDSCGHAERQVRLSVSADACILPTREATPLALITGELVSNALRHAFTETGGEVKVMLSCCDSEARLVVTDNGKGMPAWFDLADARSMGLQIVRALVEHSLAGRLEIASTCGTRVTVSFPLRSGRDRGSDDWNQRGRPVALS
jgi:two-component sensor histidine kinase